MCNRTHAYQLQHGPEVRIDEKRGGNQWQDPPDCPARGLQHEQDEKHSERQIRRIGCCRAIHELRAIHDRPGERSDRQCDEREIPPGRSRAISPAGGIDHPRCRQSKHQEHRTIDERLNDGEHPDEREAGERGGEPVSGKSGAASKDPRAALGVVRQGNPRRRTGVVLYRR